MKIMMIAPRNDDILQVLNNSTEVQLVSNHTTFLGNVPFQLWDIENLEVSQTTWHKDFGICSNGLRLRIYGRINQLGYAWFEKMDAWVKK